MRQLNKTFMYSSAAMLVSMGLVAGGMVAGTTIGGAAMYAEGFDNGTRQAFFNACMDSTGNHTRLCSAKAREQVQAAYEKDFKNCMTLHNEDGKTCVRILRLRQGERPGVWEVLKARVF